MDFQVNLQYGWLWMNQNLRWTNNFENLTDFEKFVQLFKFGGHLNNKGLFINFSKIVKF